MLLSPSRPACQSPTAPTANIFAACSALQSLLAASIPLTTTTSRSIERSLDSPIRFSAPSRAYPTKVATKKRYPSQGPTSQRKSLHTPPPAPSRKRRRDATPEPDTKEDKENALATPKRTRRCPPSLPVGLGQEDLNNALRPSRPAQPHTPFQLQPDINFMTPSHPAPLLDRTTQPAPKDGSPWTPADDSALVSVILNKLQLRQSDWDDCARRLGRGKASIGERFRLLVGDAPPVGGMRRGSGALRRGSVQRMEFGPEIQRP